MTHATGVVGLEEKRAIVYRGMNPAFVRQVWAKRRDELATVELADVPKEPAPKTAAQIFEEKAIARMHEAERKRIERLKHRMEAGGVRGIIAEVALAHRCTVEDILGPSRAAPIVKARHQAIVEVAVRRPAFTLPR